MKPFIQFKHNEDKQLFFFVNPILVSAIFDMAYWASRNGLPFNITDTISTHAEDIKLKRVEILRS